MTPAALIERIGVDRILFGSDYPLEMGAAPLPDRSGGCAFARAPA
jgi:predicted TIM-barrel fold metal-dependent hydrolase